MQKIHQPCYSRYFVLATAQRRSVPHFHDESRLLLDGFGQYSLARPRFVQRAMSYVFVLIVRPSLHLCCACFLLSASGALLGRMNSCHVGASGHIVVLRLCALIGGAGWLLSLLGNMTLCLLAQHQIHRSYTLFVAWDSSGTRQRLETCHGKRLGGAWSDRFAAEECPVD